MVIRVYNKPDSVITRIAKQARGRDMAFLQILNIIAASILFRISIMECRVIASRTCCIYIYDGGTGKKWPQLK